jgi:hypothetical protein
MAHLNPFRYVLTYLHTRVLPLTPNPLLNYRREPSSAEIPANIRLV